MPLISPFIKDSLVNQWSSEKRNANIYLSVASFLKAKGLDNIAKIFESQYKEEEEHALIIYKLLTDLGEEFDAPSVLGYSTDALNTMLDVGILYLETEAETTMSLKQIKEEASKEDGAGCSVVEKVMLDMIGMQQHEFEEATSFFDKCKLIGDDWKTALLLDASMGGN